LLFALAFAILFWPEPRIAEAQTRTPAVVFTVSGSGAEGSMDAVVLVDGKQLRAPYNSEKEDAQKKFGEQYFANGKVYRLIFGGGEAGTVKVDKWSVGCNNIHAQVTSTTSAKAGRQGDGAGNLFDHAGQAFGLAAARRPKPSGPRCWL
jgi:hypothetical protein